MNMKWILGCVGICLISIVLVWVFLPEKGTLSTAKENAALRQLLGRDPHTSDTNQSTSWVVHTSKFIQFSYPSIARVYSTDNLKAIKNGALDSFSLGLVADHIYAVIQAVHFPDGLDQYPSVMLRLTQSVYTSLASGSATKREFIRQDSYSFEHTIFFEKNGNIVSIAITGPDKISVNTLFTGITASLQIF